MENVLLIAFEQNEVNIQAGTETTAKLDLRNRGEHAISYRLQLEGVPERWVQIDPSQVSITPAGEEAVIIRIKVPSDALPALYSITIHAIDQSTQLEGGRAALKLQVNASQPSPSSQAAMPPVVNKPETVPPAPVENLVLSLTPPSQSSAGTADYTLSVANPNPRAVELNLNARDETNRLALVVDPSYLVLGPHQQGTARVHVTPTSPLQGNTKELPCTFVISARAADGTSGTTQGTLLQTRPPSSVRPWVWIAGAAGAVLLLLVCLMLGNIYAVQGVNPATPSLPASAPSLTSVPTVPPQPTALPPTRIPLPTNSPPPAATAVPTSPLAITVIITVPPQPTSIPPTRAPRPTNSPSPTATPLPPFAITNLVTIVDPVTSTKCPTTFDFSSQITSNGPGTATFFWEFSDGETTTPAAVTFKQPEQALVQTKMTASQSTTGWGRVQVTSPVQLTSNQAAFNLACGTPAPDGGLGPSQLPANPLTPGP